MRRTRLLVAPFLACLLLACLLAVSCRPRETEGGAPATATSASGVTPAPATPAATTSAMPTSALAWTHVGADSGRSGMVSEPGPEMKAGILWTSPVKANAVTEPVLARVGDRDLVLMGNGDEALALDLATGKVAWSHEANSLVSAPPLVAGTTAFVGGLDGLLLELAAADGTLIREHEWDFTVEAAPVRCGDLVLVEESSLGQQVKDSRLHGIDVATGVERWKFDFSHGTARAAACDGERAYVPTSVGILAVHLADGSAAWTHAFSPQVRVYTPIARDGRVIASYGGYGPGTIASLDAATGKVMWTAKTADRISIVPSLTENEVIVPLMDATIARFSREGGGSLPPIKLSARCDVRVAVTPSRFYVATGQTVRALDRTTFAETWNLVLQDEAVSNDGIIGLAVAGRYLVVTRLEGEAHLLGSGS